MIAFSLHVYFPPCDNTAGRWPPESQEEESPRTPLLPPWPQMSQSLEVRLFSLYSVQVVYVLSSCSTGNTDRKQSSANHGNYTAVWIQSGWATQSISSSLFWKFFPDSLFPFSSRHCPFLKKQMFNKNNSTTKWVHREQFNAKDNVFSSFH